MSQPPPKKTGRLRKIGNMVRFVKRSSIAAGLKVPGDDICYNDTFIVSVIKLFIELYLINGSVNRSVSQSVSRSVGQS